VGSPEAFLRTVVTEGPPKGAFLFSSTDVALLRVDSRPDCNRLRRGYTAPAWVRRKRHHLVKDLLKVGRDRLRSWAEAEGLLEAPRGRTELRCRNL
jgi:hypothetical protein